MNEPLTQSAPSTPVAPLVAIAPKSPQEAAQLLDSWCNVSEEEAKEQQDTFELLRSALDDSRHSTRKLFPFP